MDQVKKKFSMDTETNVYYGCLLTANKVFFVVVVVVVV